MVDLPDFNLRVGVRGTIVECYDADSYEVEFANSDGETEALCTLSSEQVIIVWEAKTKSRISVSKQVEAIIHKLSEERQREVLDFACFLYRK